MNPNKLNKIFCGLLSSILAFSCIGINRAQCMIGDETTPSTTQPAGVADLNMPDCYGCTPLIQAISDKNPSEVKRLLKLGARLDVHYMRNCGPDPSKKVRILVPMTPFETVCDHLLYYYLTKDGYGHPQYVGQPREKALREIADIILEHCAERSIPLHVNTNHFRRYVGLGERRLWDSGLRELFLEYQAQYKTLDGKDLFTFE